MKRMYVKGRVKDLHVEIAASVLGRPLPSGAHVHHVDGNRLNNSKNNLVICPSAWYHKLLHRRERARELAGNPNWLKCRFCGLWDDPKNMYAWKTKHKPYAEHRACRNEHQNAYRWRKGICQPR